MIQLFAESQDQVTEMIKDRKLEGEKGLELNMQKTECIITKTQQNFSNIEEQNRLSISDNQ